MTIHPPGSGPAITGRRHTHVFRFGEFLRRFKIDELSQLSTCCEAKTGIVAARPEDPENRRTAR